MSEKKWKTQNTQNSKKKTVKPQKELKTRFWETAKRK